MRLNAVVPRVGRVPGVIPGTHKKLLTIFEELRMNPILGRRLLAALGTLIWLGSSAVADDLGFTGMERRLGRLERPIQADSKITTAAFLADTPASQRRPAPHGVGQQQRQHRTTADFDGRRLCLRRQRLHEMQLIASP